MSDDFANQRAAMVLQQLRARGIQDEAVLRAMGQVPREQFVPQPLQALAYADKPLPLPSQQTISQPYVIGLMLEALGLRPSDKVLEVGAGSGYVAALLSHLVAQVYAVERQEKLVQYAQQRLSNYANVRLFLADGSLGLAQFAPYDAIAVAAAGPMIPPSLKNQLAINGRLIMPLGKQNKQKLVRITRRSHDKFTIESLVNVRFVPLIGQEGW